LRSVEARDTCVTSDSMLIAEGIAAGKMCAVYPKSPHQRLEGQFEIWAFIGTAEILQAMQT